MTTQKKKIFHFSLFILLGGILFAETVTLGALQWQDNSDVKIVKLSWEDAKAHCGVLDLAGHSDWRLPNIKELQSIVDINRYEPAIKSTFKNVVSSKYWSASQTVAYAKDAWTVHFKNGDISHPSKSDDWYFVRCVRHKQ